MSALDYLLKANLYGLLFVSCYWLFLRRHTFFSLNRFYLLASAILSLALPLVSLPTQTVETLPADWPVPVGVISLPMAAIATAPAQNSQAGSAPDGETIALFMYGLIAMILVLHLAVRVGRLFWLIQRSKRQVYTNYVLVEAPKVAGSSVDIPTFSFFRYLVINPANKQNELIIRHELVHIRQCHSADVLCLALLRALFWACPALWLIDKMLRQVHEFLADREASQPTEYARFLLEYTFGLQPDTLTNGFFNPSLLKQRIQMLYQTATPRWALGKYTLVLPLLLSLLAMTTARKEIASVVDQFQDEGITVMGSVTRLEDGKPLPGAIVTVANTGKGTPTDKNGFYKLTSVPVSSQLVYSHIGYRTDIVLLDAFRNRMKNNQLLLNPKLAPKIQDELPVMGATAAYRAIKPNPAMPVRTPPSSETINGQTLTAVEEPAVFPTGIPGLMQHVAHTLRYPAKARASGIQGDVYVLFTVLPTGAVGDVKINKNIKQVGGGCEEEAIRIVSQMPRWIPAKQNNKAVATQYQLPIQFVLEKKDAKRTGQVSSPKLDSSAGVYTEVYDNSRNARFALYSDVKANGKERYGIPLPDSLKPSRPTITIRSNGFDSGDPLFIIDGINASKEELDKLDKNDILNIDVQRGPAATTLYGEKAKYGAINITTKHK